MYTGGIGREEEMMLGDGAMFSGDEWSVRPPRSAADAHWRTP